MIKINGIKASILNDETERLNSQPSINQVLDKMENNFVARNTNQKTTNLQNVSVQTFANEQNQNGNIFDENNLLLTLLPLLLGNKSNKLDGDFLINQLLKKSNNPRLQKILDILSKISNIKKTKESDDKKVEKKENKIDSFVRTDDAEDKNTKNE